MGKNKDLKISEKCPVISKYKKTLIYSYTHLLIYLLIISLLISNCSTNENKTIIKINGKKIKVEVANTPAERAIGLSYRKNLLENHGVLFAFPDEARREFWMYKCNFDIDLAYIDASGVIREIVTMKKEPFNRPVDSLLKYISSSSNIKFALEMKGGWFKEHNIQIGAQLDLRGFYSAY